MGRRAVMGVTAAVVLVVAGCAGTQDSGTRTPVSDPGAEGASAAGSASPAASPPEETSPGPEASGPTFPAFDQCTAPYPWEFGPETGEEDHRVWVGDYGGGVGAEEGSSRIDLSWSLITVEDWSASDVEVTVDRLALMHLDAPDTVVAVPAEELPGGLPLEFFPGTEGGGEGSEAVLELPVTVAVCADGQGALPVGVYLAGVDLTLDVDGETVKRQGWETVFLGGYEAAVAATESYGS